MVEYYIFEEKYTEKICMSQVEKRMYGGKFTSWIHNSPL